VARTPASGSWPGSEGSGGAKTVPMQCSAMSCGATPMCVARNGCGELPRRRARYKLRWHCSRCCTTPQTGNHTAWMVSVVGTIQQSAARCPTAHSFTPQTLGPFSPFFASGVDSRPKKPRNSLDSRPSGLGSGSETRRDKGAGKCGGSEQLR